MAEYRSGFVTLVGKPNVGKSTLLNALVGRKVSITSSKPQTTWHRILGVCTGDAHQLVFVDTPGLHRRTGKTLNRIINRTARANISGVDVVVLMITGSGWKDEDRFVLDLVKGVKTPVVLAINKIDRIKDKHKLLPLIKESSELMDFAEIIPLSAKSGHNVKELQNLLSELIPEGPQCFPDDQVTDRDGLFMISELVREQLFRLLGDELPYSTAVRVAETRDEDPFHIEAHIWVEKDSQKGIVVGNKGQRIKEISTKSRQSIEKYLGKHVYLDLRVKVRKGWADSQSDLTRLGYSEGT